MVDGQNGAKFSEALKQPLDRDWVRVQGLGSNVPSKTVLVPLNPSLSPGVYATT